ncbi:hypothetical protein QE366_000924 [Nocardioides zeae]|nr:hypothetical protein [Nocardioides zeae]MDR6173665.1 hypothetical protein [Nocardioides zeae]
MPALVPMMRSGSSSAIRSYWKPSAALSTSGSAPFRRSVAQGQTAKSCSPYHSVVAIGVTPSSRSTSCSVRPTLTMRCGSDSIVVSPYSCSTVTGNVSDGSVV